MKEARTSQLRAITNCTSPRGGEQNEKQLYLESPAPVYLPRSPYQLFRLERAQSPRFLTSPNSLLHCSEAHDAHQCLSSKRGLCGLGPVRPKGLVKGQESVTQTPLTEGSLDHYWCLSNPCSQQSRFLECPPAPVTLSTDRIKCLITKLGRLGASPEARKLLLRHHRILAR